MNASSSRDTRTFCDQSFHEQLDRSDLDNLADKVIVSAAAAAADATILARIEIAQGGLEEITHDGTCRVVGG